MPNAVLEAVTSGLPVVASSVGGVPEIIDDVKTGYLIKPYNNVDKFVNCLENINNNKQLLPEMANCAYEKISKRHSWQEFLNSLKNIQMY